MNVRRMTTPAGTTLSSTCATCGSRYRTIIDNPDRAARAHVQHLCGSGAVGPLWTLTTPPPAPPRPTEAVA